MSIWLLLFLGIAHAFVPTQPARFGSVQPFRLWSFRQSDCLTSSIPEDVNGTLSLVSTSICPSRSTFSNAMIGVKTVDSSAENALRTAPFAGNMDSLHLNPSKKELALLFWITTTTNITSGSYLLMNIGPTPATETTVGGSVSSNKMQVSFNPTFLKLEFKPFGTLVTIECLFSAGLGNAFTDPSAVNAMTRAGNRIFVLLSVKPGSYAFYVGLAGGNLTVCEASDIANYASFTMRSTADSVLSIGSGLLAGSAKGFLAEYHTVALFDRWMNLSLAQTLFASGMPNSVPATASLFMVVDEDTPAQLDMFTSYFDGDGDNATAFLLETLPSRATLSRAVEVLASGPLLFTQTVPDTFSVLNPRCQAPFYANHTFTSFTYRMTDGKGDGSAFCGTHPSCLSPLVGTVSVCVRETNDVPDIWEGGRTEVQLAETVKLLALQCSDRDSDVARFGLKFLRLTSQSRPELGSIVAAPNGRCGNGTFLALPYVYSSLTLTPNVRNTTHFCYHANTTTLAQTLIGTDRISFECEDQAGGVAASYLDVEIRNALVPGCGLGMDADKTPCIYRGREDTSLFFSLQGYDGVLAHINNASRQFRVDTVPELGELYTGVRVRVMPGDVLNGTGNLEFVPPADYFNSLCALNTNPGPVCPGSYVDGLGLAFHNCTSASGCPLTFTFAMGYNNVFSTPYVKGARIFIQGVNDALRNASAPSAMDMPLKSTAYYFRDVESGWSLEDPDGDTYRIGFNIEQPFGTKLRLPSDFYNPLESTGRRRIIFFSGGSCYENGCSPPTSLGGRAYLSDLRRLLRSVYIQHELSPTHANGTLVVRFWDPVSYPGQGETPINIDMENVTFTLLTVTRYGTPTESVVDFAVSGGIWAAAAGGILFVLLSCVACVGGILARAKRGSRSARWISKNVLCTEVMDPTDLTSVTAGGRRSLEVAIHGEHVRMAQAVRVAVCLRRLCPCFVKFDQTGEIPDEETIMKQILAEESHVIAMRHVPKETALVGMEMEVDEEVQEEIFDWEKQVDEASGRQFYYNTRTNESSWTPPSARVKQVY